MRAQHEIELGICHTMTESSFLISIALLRSSSRPSPRLNLILFSDKIWYPANSKYCCYPLQRRSIFIFIVIVVVVTIIISLIVMAIPLKFARGFPLRYLLRPVFDDWQLFYGDIYFRIVPSRLGLLPPSLFRLAYLVSDTRERYACDWYAREKRSRYIGRNRTEIFRSLGRIRGT
jgi:hypothetical protein